MAKFQKIPLSAKRSKMVATEGVRLLGWIIAEGAVLIGLLNAATTYRGALCGHGEHQILEDMGLKKEVDDFVAAHYDEK